MDSPAFNVVNLGISDKRDPAAALRAVADAIDAGEYGEVGEVAVVVIGDRLEVFSGGPDHNPCSTAMLLHAGFFRMSQAIANHGQD